MIRASYANPSIPLIVCHTMSVCFYFSPFQRIMAIYAALTHINTPNNMKLRMGVKIKEIGYPMGPCSQFDNF
jgi:hypothetical protein